MLISKDTITGDVILAELEITDYSSVALVDDADSEEWKALDAAVFVPDHEAALAGDYFPTSTSSATCQDDYGTGIPEVFLGGFECAIDANTETCTAQSGTLLRHCRRSCGCCASPAKLQECSDDTFEFAVWADANVFGNNGTLPPNTDECLKIREDGTHEHITIEIADCARRLAWDLEQCQIGRSPVQCQYIGEERDDILAFLTNVLTAIDAQATAAG